MADTIQSIRSLQLHDLIGSILTAIVRADAQAALATLEFIQTIGFVPPPEDEEREQSEGGPSQLQMAEFRYRKLDENEEVSEFVASVPILSLVPIPALQTKEANLSFSAKITDIGQEQKNQAVDELAGPQFTTSKLLQPLSYRLLAKPVAASGAKEAEVRGTFHLDIDISLSQADIPLGMEKIFNLMDQAIRDNKVPPPE